MVIFITAKIVTTKISENPHARTAHPSSSLLLAPPLPGHPDALPRRRSAGRQRRGADGNPREHHRHFMQMRLKNKRPSDIQDIS